MLSSRASSGRKPWVAAEPMISSRPRPRAPRNARDEVAVDRVEQAPQPVEPLAPELDQRQQVRLAGAGERLRRLVAGREPLVEERLELVREQRVASWLARTGVNPMVTGAGDVRRRSSAWSVSSSGR